MSAEVELEELAKSLQDRAPLGELTAAQAYDHALHTPEGAELYARYRAEKTSEVND